MSPIPNLNKLVRLKENSSMKNRTKRIPAVIKKGTPLSHFNIELLITNMFDIVYCLALNPIRLFICDRDDSTRHLK